MKNKLNTFHFAIASIIISCGNSTNRSITENKNFSELEKANYLIGEWQSTSPEGSMVEQWVKKNDSIFSGRSCFIVGKDTVSSEEITLEQNGNKLFYIPTVKEQNSNQPVKFILTSASDKQLIFENPDHDFPQKISYTRSGQDEVIAEISGIVEGKNSSQSFPMRRVK